MRNLRESVGDSVKSKLIDEARKRADVSLMLCLGHLATASMYGSFNFWVGMINTILAATAGASALSQFDSSGKVTGVLSVMVAVLTALLTFLNPSDRSKFHWDAANELEQLSVQFSRYVDVLSETEESVQALETLLDELLNNYFSATRKYPIPGWALAFALKSMKKPGGAMQLARERWFNTNSLNERYTSDKYSS